MRHPDEHIADQMLENIWLGNIDAANNDWFINKYKISVIINLSEYKYSKTFYNVKYLSYPFKYRQISLYDSSHSFLT